MGETPLRVEFYRLGALTSVTVVSASISGHTMCPRGRPRVVRLVEGYDECRTDAGDVVPGHNDEMTVGRERVGRLPQITCWQSSNLRRARRTSQKGVLSGSASLGPSRSLGSTRLILVDAEPWRFAL